MDLEMFIYLFVLIFVLTIISVGGALFIILDIYLIQKLSEKIDIEISLINIVTLPSALVVLGTLGKHTITPFEELCLGIFIICMTINIAYIIYTFVFYIHKKSMTAHEPNREIIIRSYIEESNKHKKKKHKKARKQK